MAIQFKDFVPQVSGETKVLFFNVPSYQSLEELMAEVNSWVQNSAVDVVNIETLVLPNLELEQTSSVAVLRTPDDRDSDWYQIVRVWYRG